jgi:flagellar biosynthesis/type III secretory pathway chaperone
MHSELASLLAELSAIQTDLLRVLTDKRHRLLTSDTAAMEALRDKEAELIGRLQACQERRQALLAQAAAEGLPASDLRSLADALPASERMALSPRIREAAARMRLLQHHSLTNWVLVQRTLIHLSQVLEIIATGGRLKPTYGKGDSVDSGGVLVDQAA